MSDESSDNRETVTNQNFLDAIREAESPVLATSEIAEMDEIPVTQAQIRKRLKSLVEEDRLGSKSYSAKPQIRLWWHKGVDLKKKWPSDDDDTTNQIGVEVVDVLDLPGRGEKLQKRREAVNAVFKFLVKNETAGKRDLFLVGWGADMETYANPHSLWNNCLKKALDQSPFYLFNKLTKKWELSELGIEIKQMADDGLWNNWNDHKKTLDEKYHSIFWNSFPDITSPNSAVEVRKYNSELVLHSISKNIYFSNLLAMDGSVWNCSTGDFSAVVEFSHRPEHLKTIFDNKDELTSDYEINTQWIYSTDDYPSVLLLFSRPIDIDVSKMLKQQEKRYMFVDSDLKKLVQWKNDAMEQLSVVAQEVSQLFE